MAKTGRVPRAFTPARTNLTGGSAPIGVRLGTWQVWKGSGVMSSQPGETGPDPHVVSVGEGHRQGNIPLVTGKDRGNGFDNPRSGTISLQGGRDHLRSGGSEMTQTPPLPPPPNLELPRSKSSNAIPRRSLLGLQRLVTRRSIGIFVAPSPRRYASSSRSDTLRHFRHGQCKQVR